MGHLATPEKGIVLSFCVNDCAVLASMSCSLVFLCLIDAAQSTSKQHALSSTNPCSLPPPPPQLTVPICLNFHGTPLHLFAYHLL